MLLNRSIQLSRTINVQNLTKIHRLVVCNTRSSSSKTKTNEANTDAPIKYSSTEALRWKAKTTRMGREEPRLWYEPYVIMGSLTIFMIYFTMLREENDIDEELTKSLYSRIEGLEEHQLRVVLRYNTEHNLPTDDIIKRLNEIENERLHK